MEKECALCGKLFETPTKIRKYCDDCLRHEKLNRADIAYAQKRTRSYMKPKVLELKCAQCGKEFKTISKLVFRVSQVAYNGDSKDHVFCSQKCVDQFHIEHAKCRVCGKDITDSPTFNPHAWSTWYCSDECKEIERWDTARKEGRVHTCLQCGKEFIRKDGGFCSRTCYKEAVDNGWNPRSGKEALRTIQRNVECPVCHRRWVKTYKGKFTDADLSRPVVCSQKCAGVFAKRLAKEKAEKKRLEAILRKTIEEERDLLAGAEVDLCATCKIPYKECERMQSEFRIIPKGARYNERGKLVECPKYKT